MNRNTARLVREALETELAKILKPFNARVNQVSLRFGDTGCTATVDIRDGATESKQKEVDAAIFASLCHRFGLEPKDFGRFFRSGGQLYRLVGLNNRPKYCVVGEQARTKKQYLFTTDVLEVLQPPHGTLVDPPSGMLIPTKSPRS